jgi:FAD-dependent urate hydroxylase
MAEPQPKKTTIAIVGAGIAGPVFALTILSHPTLSQLYKPVIYERLPAPSASGPSGSTRTSGGAAVALTSNALYPLYQLGFRKELDAISCATERIQIFRAYPANQNAVPMGKYLNQILSPNWKEDLGTCLRVVERASLQSILLGRVRELGGEVLYDMRFLGTTQGESGVMVAVEGREVETVGLVVGADGGFSSVRRALISSKFENGVDKRWNPYFAGADAIYGISRAIAKPFEDDVGENAVDGSQQREGDTHWIFLDGGMGSTWALRDGKTFWTLTFFSKTAPERTSKQRNVEHSLYGSPISLGGYTLEETQMVLEKYENAWHPTTATFGNLLRNSEKIVRTPLYYRAWEGDQIAGDNLVLIGDASRLMLPTSGQGNLFLLSISRCQSVLPIPPRGC